MYRPSQFQVSGFGDSADVPRITPREFYYFCASTQITLFGISEDVRRKTPRDYYHFAHLRTIQCFGISADVRRKTAQDYFHFSAPTQVTIVWSFCGQTQKNSTCLVPFCASTHISVFWSFCGYTQILLLLKCDSCPNNTHDVLNQPELEFLRPYADTPNLDEKLTHYIEKQRFSSKGRVVTSKRSIAGVWGGF